MRVIAVSVAIVICAGVLLDAQRRHPVSGRVFAPVMGVRKKPSEERGPKLIIAITQPQITTTSGVRQPTELTALVAPCNVMTEFP